MKKALVTLFSLVFASAVTAADAVVAGFWQMESEVVGNASVSFLTFKQEGNKLTGTTKGADEEPQAIAGKVEKKKITWSSESDWAGNTLALVYVGTLNDAGVIVGSVEVQPMGIEGEFSAKRVEKPEGAKQ